MHMVNNITLLPYMKLLSPETFQKLLICSLTLPPDVYMVHNRNFTPLNILNSAVQGWSLSFLRSHTCVHSSWVNLILCYRVDTGWTPFLYRSAKICPTVPTVWPWPLGYSVGLCWSKVDLSTFLTIYIIQVGSDQKLRLKYFRDHQPS